MEGMGKETLPFLKSRKRQKVHLERSVSTHFVAFCSYSPVNLVMIPEMILIVL